MTFEEAWAGCETIPEDYSMSEDDVQALYYAMVDLDLNANSVIVELGVCRGHTSAMLAYFALHTGADYHGVDTFGLVGTALEFEEHLDALDYPYTLWTTATQDVPWSSPIDVLLIDAGHDEVSVKLDCEKWIPFVRSGGIVAFDDWDERSVPFGDAHWAIKVYGDLYTAGWKEEYTQRMMMRWKP